MPARSRDADLWFEQRHRHMMAHLPITHRDTMDRAEYDYGIPNWPRAPLIACGRPNARPAGKSCARPCANAVVNPIRLIDIVSLVDEHRPASQCVSSSWRTPARRRRHSFRHRTPTASGSSRFFGVLSRTLLDIWAVPSTQASASRLHLYRPLPAIRYGVRTPRVRPHPRQGAVPPFDWHCRGHA